MKKIVVRKIPLEMDLEDLIRNSEFSQMRRPISDQYIRLVGMLTDIFHPQAIFRECAIDAVASNIVSIDGYIYKSKSLKTILKDHQRVFPYVLTLGQSPNLENRLDNYLISTLQFPVMISAMKYLKKIICEQNNFSSIGIVNPGLITDWSIKSSQTIFETIGRVKEEIGVEIKENNIMMPGYSSSGILFEDVFSYCECDKCSIDACIGREAIISQGQRELI